MNPANTIAVWLQLIQTATKRIKAQRKAVEIILSHVSVNCADLHHRSGMWHRADEPCPAEIAVREAMKRYRENM